MRLKIGFVLMLLTGACATKLRLGNRDLDRIVVSPDSRGFIAGTSHRTFRPWGMNYGNSGRLIEDFWERDWQTVVDDFGEMKALGANVVRVHLQYNRFMSSAETPNQKALTKLRKLIRLAKATGLYLDITGLACYRPSDTPAWYETMDEPARWQAQAVFWEIVATTCAESTAVFCYDLINEPLSPGGKRAAGQWRSGSDFGGFDFLQFIALDPAGRNREDIAVEWIRKMTAAIRKHDRDALITVGLLPWSREWKFLSGFVPEKVAPELDFISVHIYPDSKKPSEAMEGLAKFAVGKPVVIEETFPLSCTLSELEAFLRASRKYATGWLGHYDGQSVDELNALQKAGKLTVAQAIYRSWLDLFIRLKGEFGT